MRFLSFFKSSNAPIQNRHNFRSMDSEFSQEIPVNTSFSTTQSDNSYINSGVLLIKANNKCRLSYNGLLAKSGAKDVYVTIGYGSNQKWEDIEYHRMDMSSNQTYELNLPIKRPGNINIAFKDGANNWDNNSNRNYTFHNFLYGGNY